MFFLQRGLRLQDRTVEGKELVLACRRLAVGGYTATVTPTQDGCFGSAPHLKQQPDRKRPRQEGARAALLDTRLPFRVEFAPEPDASAGMTEGAVAGREGAAWRRSEIPNSRHRAFEFADRTASVASMLLQRPPP